MDYEQQEKAVAAIKAALNYVQQAHDDAEEKHENYGEYYMDDGQQEIMEDTESLIAKMNAIICWHEQNASIGYDAHDVNYIVS